MSNRTSKSTNVTEATLAPERMGRNSLQGNDQANVRNQRKAAAEQLDQPDRDVRESFRRMDKNVRARGELGKKPDPNA